MDLNTLLLCTTNIIIAVKLNFYIDSLKVSNVVAQVFVMFNKFYYIKISCNI